MHGKPDGALLDRMVRQTASYFREREEEILSGSASLGQDFAECRKTPNKPFRKPK
jgi:hypothetical protein